MFLVLDQHTNLSAADLSKASAKVKSEIPGRTNQAQKEGEKYAQEAGKYAHDAGAKVDSYVSFQFPLQLFYDTDANALQVQQTKAELTKAEGKVEAYTKDAKKDAMSKIDAADKKILEESAKAKSGISSWFGGK